MILRFGQYVQWLKNHLTNFQHATQEEREAMVRSMTGDNAMPDDTDSPTFGFSEDARDHLIRNHGVMHGHYLRLLELETVEMHKSLLDACGDAFRTIVEPPSDNDEEMETNSQTCR